MIGDYTCPHRNCERKGAYSMRMCCGNCGLEYIGKFTKGHDTLGAHKCPRCECRDGRVLPDGWIEA